ncbi:MAG: DUF885 family protein [Caldilineaceae bacterium]
MNSGVNGEFKAWLARFFASYYRHRPVNATFIGEHDYDSLLPDFSAEGVAAAVWDAETLLREAGQIDVDALTPVERMDKRLAEGFLRIQQWEFGSDHFQRGNPALYTGEAIFGAIGLFLTDYAPFAERAQAACARMHALEGLLAQGRENVRRAPAAWTQRALRECAGAKAFFGAGIDTLAAGEPTGGTALKAELRRAADAALEAFARHERYLADELSTAPIAAPPCGPEALDLLLREGHCLRQTADEILSYALQKMEEAEAYLVEHARDFGAADWREALGGLSAIHPTVEGYLGRYAELWESSRELVRARDLVTWPDFPIEYVPQPRWAREAAPHLYFLFYRAPAAYNRPPVHRYLVTPIEPDMPPDEQVRRLQATNDSVIKLNHVVHHGGVGHHVQNYNAYHGASQIGRVAAVDCAARIAMFCGGTMAEGWACYATQLMAEQGFLTPLEEYGEAHADMRMAARAVVDVRLHRGEITVDEAAQFYASRTAMSSAAAQGEAVKNSMFPGAALMYLMGRDTILDLRADLKRRFGSSFSLREFHDRFLSFGSVPVALVAETMRREAAAQPRVL